MKFNIHNKTWAFHHSLGLLFFLLHIYCFLFSTSFDIGLLQNLWFFRNDKCLNYVSHGFFISDTTLVFILYFNSRTISLQYFILHHYLFSSFSPSSAFTFCLFSLDVWASFEIGYGLFITVIFHTKLIASKELHMHCSTLLFNRKYVFDIDVNRLPNSSPSQSDFRILDRNFSISWIFSASAFWEKNVWSGLRRTWADGFFF